MNYRSKTDLTLSNGAVGIEVTGAAIDAGQGIYGTLAFARADLADKIDKRIHELQALKRKWLHTPEAKLPIDTEAAHEEGSGL